MFLKPKFIKYKKHQKRRNKGLSNNSNILFFGKYGLKCITRGRVTSNQLESSRKVLSKFLKKEGKIWLRIFPDKPLTKKPIELRMGGGKGDFSHYVFEIKPGRILYEIFCNSENLARKIFKLASYKLPFKTIFIKI